MERKDQARRRCPLILSRGLMDLLTVVDFDIASAKAAAELRRTTRDIGLSLGDRACLALGRLTGMRVLTADATWSAVSGVEVVQIRLGVRPGD